MHKVFKLSVFGSLILTALHANPASAVEACSELFDSNRTTLTELAGLRAQIDSLRENGDPNARYLYVEFQRAFLDLKARGVSVSGFELLVAAQSQRVSEKHQEEEAKIVRLKELERVRAKNLVLSDQAVKEVSVRSMRALRESDSYFFNETNFEIRRADFGKKNKAKVGTVAFENAGTKMVLSESDRYVAVFVESKGESFYKMFDVATAQNVDSGFGSAAAFNKYSTQVAIAKRSSVVVRELQTMKDVLTIPIEIKFVSPEAMAFSPTGAQLAVLALGKVFVFDAHTGQELAKFENEAFEYNSAIEFSKDGGGLLVSKSHRHSATYVNLETRVIRPLNVNGELIELAIFSEDGHWIYGVSPTGKVSSWYGYDGSYSGVAVPSPVPTGSSFRAWEIGMSANGSLSVHSYENGQSVLRRFRPKE